MELQRPISSGCEASGDNQGGEAEDEACHVRRAGPRRAGEGREDGHEDDADTGLLPAAGRLRSTAEVAAVLFRVYYAYTTPAEPVGLGPDGAVVGRMYSLREISTCRCLLAGSADSTRAEKNSHGARPSRQHHSRAASFRSSAQIRRSLMIILERSGATMTAQSRSCSRLTLTAHGLLSAGRCILYWAPTHTRSKDNQSMDGSRVPTLVCSYR